MHHTQVVAEIRPEDSTTLGLPQGAELQAAQATSSKLRLQTPSFNVSSPAHSAPFATGLGNLAESGKERRSRRGVTRSAFSGFVLFYFAFFSSSQQSKATRLHWIGPEPFPSYCSVAILALVIANHCMALF